MADKITKEEITNISQSLAELVKNDREARNEIPKNWEKIDKVDVSNFKALQKIVKQHGYIDEETFGKESSDNAWLIVQHAPEGEVGFMEEYCKLIEKNLYKSNKKNYAYLKDRVLLYKKVKQIFGTQFKTDKTDDTIYFNDLDDPTNIDKRRASVDLPPLSEYIKIIEENFDKKVKIPEGYTAK